MSLAEREAPHFRYGSVIYLGHLLMDLEVDGFNFVTVVLSKLEAVKQVYSSLTVELAAIGLAVIRSVIEKTSS